MSETEFELMDELYFVQHYSFLKEELQWEDDQILSNLESLHEQEWIKCLRTPDEEIFNVVDFKKEGKKLFYLATKKGLMAHNTI
jgi:hypothetical protein